MKFFLTGATGFIGSYIVRHALSAGHSVLAHRRKPTTNTRIKLPHAPLWLECPLDKISVDLVQDCDAIIHLAATGVSPRVSSWSELYEVNIRNTLLICELAKAANASLVMSGSYAEYGLSGLRYREIPADAPLEPTSPYAASKAAGGMLSMSYARSEKMALSYLRIFNAFGYGQHKSNLWPSLRNAAQNDFDFDMTPGEQIRDFIPVEDVAKAFLDEAISLDAHDHIVSVKNIASGKSQSIRQFCKFWWEKWEATGKLNIGALPYREGEVMRYVPKV